MDFEREVRNELERRGYSISVIVSSKPEDCGYIVNYPGGGDHRENEFTGELPFDREDRAWLHAFYHLLTQSDFNRT